MWNLGNKGCSGTGKKLKRRMIMAFSSLAEIDDYMKTNKCEFWEAVIREEARDSQQPEMDIVNRMTQMYRSMKEADEAYDDSLTSHSGLSGKNGKKWLIMRRRTNVCVVDLAEQSWQGQSRWRRATPA